MADPTATDYQQVADDYANQLKTFFAPVATAGAPAAPAGSAVTRGGPEAAPTLPAATLAERAEQLAPTSQELGNLTIGYLSVGEITYREAAQLKLLAQATAELELANNLLETAQAEENRTTNAPATRSGGLGTARLQQTLTELTATLVAPLEQGVQVSPTPGYRSGLVAPIKNVAEGKSRLEKAVDQSLKDICKQASQVGGLATRNLLLLDAASLQAALSLVWKDAGARLDELAQSIVGVVVRLVKAATRLILQAVQWVSALLGQEIEQKVREQIGHWLDELKKTAKPGEEDATLFGKFVTRLYAPDTVRQEVKGWLDATTQTDLEKYAQTNRAIEDVADRYRHKMQPVERILKVVAYAGFVPFIKTPPGQVVIAAINASLLGYVLFSGHDHLGQVGLMQHLGFLAPNSVVGVRELAQDALVASSN